MTSELKCPFCNGKLYGCIGHPYCRNEKCEMCDEMMPQELLDLLERTRKALEIARKAMNQVMSMGAKNNICYHLKAKTVKSILGNALTQIEHIADASKMIEPKE